MRTTIVGAGLLTERGSREEEIVFDGTGQRCLVCEQSSLMEGDDLMTLRGHWHGVARR